MKKIFAILCFSISTLFLFAQKILTIEGTTVSNNEQSNWNGVVIQRNLLTAFTYKNNSVTSVNGLGYMLQAGDEVPASSNNQLDGAVITGNQFIWNGTDMVSITHGVFTGYNINAVIKYNYLDRVPMGIIRKSNGMTNTSGGVAYNIIKEPMVGVNVKGMNGVCIYNNTFYSSKTLQQTWRGLVHVYSNDNPVAASTGTKIKNNIFYTTHKINNITIEDAACLTGFESDYNVFWCEEGTPEFNYLGTSKTFAQWQEMGYDQHSVVVNPHFMNIENFVPNSRLDYGTNLGASWQSGLSTEAVWGTSSPKTSTQNGSWQAGARIISGTIGIPGQSSDGIQIYPNPLTNGQLNVELNTKNTGQFDLSILDLSGRSLIHKLYQKANSLSIDLSALPSGLYLIQLNSADFLFSGKFIIR